MSNTQQNKLITRIGQAIGMGIGLILGLTLLATLGILAYRFLDWLLNL